MLKNHIFVILKILISKIVPLISNVIETLCISWFSPKNKLVKFIDPYSQKFLEYDQSNSGQKYIYIFFKICITLCKVHDRSLLGWSYLVCRRYTCAQCTEARPWYSLPMPEATPSNTFGCHQRRIGGPWIILDSIF